MAPDKPLDTALVWFRRDLRTEDQAALFHACKEARRVWCAFVFDVDILDPLPRDDRRVDFIHASLVDLDRQLRALGAPHGRQPRLIVRHGHAPQEITRLAAALHVQAVYANRDDDPSARERDAKTRGLLADAGIALHMSKDQVIFEGHELTTAGGTPYSVFTPYRNAWLKKVEADPFYLRAYPVERHADSLCDVPDGIGGVLPTLADIGFRPSNLRALKIAPGTEGGRQMWTDFRQRIDDYARTRDFPAIKGPSYLSVHLRFGTLSIRELARFAWERSRQPGGKGARTWLSELIWRDFFHQILHHHPHVVSASFRPAFDKLRWEHGKHADALFAAWCEGRTGYPIVDAAMAQLNQTGYMHNRLRMITASFLTKDLGIDWRRGERYFAEKLNDYDLASNNGGWQWAASTGCDAQPYFRLFNPVAQSERFDPDGRFIRRYLPQLARLPDARIHAPWKARPADLTAAGVTLGRDYPAPIVDHAEARRRTLERFAALPAGPGGPRRR